MNISNNKPNLQLNSVNMTSPFYYFGINSSDIDLSINPDEFNIYDPLSPLKQFSLTPIMSLNNNHLIGVSSVNHNDIQTSYLTSLNDTITSTTNTPSTSSTANSMLCIKNNDIPSDPKIVTKKLNLNRKLTKSQLNRYKTDFDNKSSITPDKWINLSDEEYKKLKRKRGNTESQARTRAHNASTKKSHQKNDKLINELNKEFFIKGYNPSLLQKLFSEYCYCPEKERPKKQ